MMDPSRILSTGRAGLERELLRSALTDVAPDEVRARVLHSVGAALATSAASSATAGAATPGGAGLGAGAGSKLLGGLSVRAVCLGALLVAGVGVGFALNQRGERSTDGQQAERLEGQLREGSPLHEGSRPQEGQLRGGKPTGIESAPEAPASAPASLPEASADRATPGALANTGAHVSGTEDLSDRTRTDDSEPVEAASSTDTAAKEIPPDWLGEQLQLLREARGQLESGNLERAAELLDSYEQRFAGGVIGPQIRALRAELRQQRSSSSPVP